jgi:hypothetical protein
MERGMLCVDRLDYDQSNGPGMRLPSHEIEPGMWVTLPIGTGMVLDIGEGEYGKVQLGVLLEYPPPNCDYFIANLYHHDFLEVRNDVENG